MDVPQTRERVFFVANRGGYKPLKLNFNHDPILFGTVRSEEGEPCEPWLQKYLPFIQPSDKDLGDLTKRVCKDHKLYSYKIIPDNKVMLTLTTRGSAIRLYDRKQVSKLDLIRCFSFPRDYDFDGNEVRYVCGMSVAPNMMANIATEIWEQWLKPLK